MSKINILDAGSLSANSVANTVNSLTFKVDDLSNSLGDINQHGNSSSQSFNSSITSTIGDISKLGIDAPIGETITNFSESISPNPVGDFYLTLEPISDVSISDGNNTYVMTDITSLSDNTHYAIHGRKLVFYKAPTNIFTVTYKGKFPTIPGYDKYTPNVFPNLLSVRSGHQEKSKVAYVDTGTYEVSIQQLFKIGDTLIPNGLYASLPDRLRPFVSPSGSIKAPTEDVSVWVYSDGRYQKVNDASVYLMSDHMFRFKTSIDLSKVSNDLTIVLSVNSWSISDSIEFLSKLIVQHSHNGSDLSSPILHRNLSGLRAERYIRDGAEYGVSLYKGDDHPQYFNRDGYVDGNPGNFNNAIIGDVLLGSSNSYNLYNNILDNSRKLFFGSVSDGSSLMYDRTFGGLKLFGSDSGLKISTHAKQSSTDNAYAIGLEIDGNKIYSTGDKGGEDNILNIESKTGVAKFVSSLGGLSKIIAKDLDVRDINASGAISVSKDSSIKIGDVEFKPEESGSVLVQSENNEAKISFDVPVSIKDLDVDSISPKDLSISDDAKISFGANSIRSDGGTLTIDGKSPITISDSGKNTGIRYKKQDSLPFGNIYTSAENGGSATETDHDVYIESGSGKTIFLKDSTKVQTAHGKSYAFGELASGEVERVDNLKNLPKGDIDAGNANFYSVSILPSSLKDRRGINIGDTSAIYATGTDTECPPGWLVVESKNGVVFVDSRSGAIDCQTMVYSEVSTGDIKAFGTVSIDKELGVSGDINSGGGIAGQSLSVREVANIGELNVLGDSRFTGHVGFTEDVAINSSLSVGGSITSKNKIHANELEVDSSTIFNGPVTISRSAIISGNVVADGSFNTSGDASVGGRLSVNTGRFDNITVGRLKTTDVLEAAGGIETTGSLTVTGNIDTQSDIIADGGRFSTQVKTNNLVVESDQTVGNELYVANRFQAAGDVTLGSDSNDKLNVNSNTVFNNEKTAFIGLVDISDNTSLKSDLDVLGQATFGSLLSARSGINLGGPVTSTSTAEFTSVNVKGPAFIKEDILASGSIKVLEALHVSKGGIIEGDISLGTKGANIIISSDAHFNNSKNTFSGEVLMTEKLTVSGDAVVNSTMNVRGGLRSDGNLDVEGLTTLKSVKVELNSEFKGGLSVEKQAQIETLHATGKAVFDGDITSSGNAYITGDLAMPHSSSATFGSLNVLSAINQSDNKVDNQIAGNTIFNNKVSVSGNLDVKGAIISGSDTSGMLIEGNSLTLIGDTSSVRSKTAYIDTIIGTSNRVIPSIGGKNSGAAATAANLSTKRYTTFNNIFIEDAQVNQGDIFCHGTLYVGDMQIIEVPGAERRFEESNTVMNIRARRAKYAP